MAAAHHWLTEPTRLKPIWGLFVLVTLCGVLFTKYGDHRSGFFGLVGFAGLVEIGATTAAWLTPLVALIVAAFVGRWTTDDRGEHLGLTFAYLGLALVHPLNVFAPMFTGEKSWQRPQVVRIELSRQAQKDLDERLRAWGMP